ncbi:hypothetical protein GCM10028784_20260 [Myceligenerans cantabricum]
MTSSDIQLPLTRPRPADAAEGCTTAPVPVPAGLPAEERRSVAQVALATLLYRYAGTPSFALDVVTPTGTETAEYCLDPTASLEDLEPQDVVRHAPGTSDAVATLTVDAPAPSAVADVELRVTPEAWTVRLGARTFVPQAAEQYARHLGAVIEAAVGDEKTAVADVALLSPDENDTIVFDWNRTEEPVSPLYIHELVARIAQQDPGRHAVRDGQEVLTYGELEDQANELAATLEARGVTQGDRIGVCMPRCGLSLVAQMACFKLSAAAILLDPDFPADRLEFMLHDAGAVLALTLDAHRAVVDGGVPVLALDADDWSNPGRAAHDAPPAGDDLIHICYTSGSTGKPKAVMVRFEAARNLVHSMREVCGMDSGTRGAWMAAPGYGMVEVEVFPVLAAGGTVLVPDADVIPSPERLQQWLLQESVTHALMMKAMAERLWTLPWPQDTPLRNIRICGERVQAWPPADLPFAVMNLYGSAEATVVACCDLTEMARTEGEGLELRMPPIGRPTANVRTHVLDPRLRPVPVGVIGELCVVGDSLSAGYLGLPEATAEKWVANPIDPERRPTLYRTGDMARYWIDGSIEIVGRTDHQVKIRGHRVHLGEIEVLIAEQPGVRQTVVLAKRDAQGDAWLAAYVEPRRGEVPDVVAIRAALAERLPAFMVPTAYVVGEFPLTTNGKIDRKALPEPPRARPELSTPYSAPRGDVEERLAGLWRSVLEIEGIGRDDNFFELGGTSLRAARIGEQVQRAFEVQIPVEDLLEGPTIAVMAELLAATESDDGRAVA